MNSETTDRKAKDMTSEDYYRIMIEKNPTPCKKYIKEYGDLVKAKAELNAVKQVKESNQDVELPFGFKDLIKAKEAKLQIAIEFCTATIMLASICGYSKD